MIEAVPAEAGWQDSYKVLVPVANFNGSDGVFHSVENRGNVYGVVVTQLHYLIGCYYWKIR